MKIKTQKKEKPEHKIQNEILEYLTKLGIFCWRNQNTGLFDPFSGKFRRKGKYQMLGISDILGVCRGIFIAIEVKSEKGKASDYQKQFLEMVNYNGGIGFIARSVKDVEDNLWTTTFKIGKKTKL